MTKRPFVSICIPTYNGAKYLEETLHSISCQTYQNIELIISDDASIDETLQLVEKFKNQVNFPVHIFYHTPKGIGANWNNCLKHASGKYIKFLFQDDVMERDCLEIMVQALEDNPKVSLVASKRNFIIEENVNTDATKEWLDKFGDLQKEFTPSNGLYMLTKDIFKSKTFYDNPKNKIGEPSTVLFKKCIIDEVGYFDENLKQILDYEYWYRILKKYPIIVIDESLVKFRLHNDQATSVNNNQVIDDYKRYEQILYKHYYSLLHPELRKRLYLKHHPYHRMKKRMLNKLKHLFA